MFMQLLAYHINLLFTLPLANWHSSMLVPMSIVYIVLYIRICESKWQFVRIEIVLSEEDNRA